MKRYLLSAAAIALLGASPAFALKITNLDTVTHTVVLSGGGAGETVVIAPNATVILPGAKQGFLSLQDAPVAAAKKGKKAAPKHDSVVHADGLLSGIIGNERTSGIPAEPLNNYVIWPGGKLNLQSRTRQGMAF